MMVKALVLAACHEEKELLLAELQRESDVKKRKALVDRLQAIFYEDVGRVKLGDYFTLDVARRDLRGDFRTRRGSTSGTPGSPGEPCFLHPAGK